MAYQITRTKKLTEELELVDEKGDVSEVIKVELDASKMVEKLSIKYTNLLRAQQDAVKMAADLNNKDEMLKAYETLGLATIDLLEGVFGKIDAEKIRKFYGDNYIEMVQQVLPFVTNIIIPKVRGISQENRKEILKNYNRKTRRSINKNPR